MPEQWLEAEYRARVEAWVDAGTNAFSSADKLYAYLRNTEFSAPRSVVRDVWRETIAAKEYIPLINRLDPDSLIPRSWVKTTDYNYSEPYAVKVKVTGELGLGPGVNEHYVTLLYGSMPTRGQIGEDYAGALEASNLSYSPSSLSFKIERVTHRRGASW